MRTIFISTLLALSTQALAEEELVCIHQCPPSVAEDICDTIIIEDNRSYYTKTDDISIAEGKLESGVLVTNIWHTVLNNDQILQLIDLESNLSSGSLGVHTATFLRTSQHFTLGFQGVVNNKNSLPQAFNFQVVGKCVAVKK
jgi:hypothetical protein